MVDRRITRGSLREVDEETTDGCEDYGQIIDPPDDAIVVDLREDEASLNWTKYGPDDSRKRFSEWSDEEARERMEDY